MVRLIHETPDYLVIEKPAGMLVHPPKLARISTEHPSPELVSWLLERYPEIREVGDRGLAGELPERPGIIHRLDRDTSGVLVVARTQKFFEFLKERFQAHEVVKRYRALVWGAADREGNIDLPIGLKSGTTKHSTSARNLKMVKPAITGYRTLELFESAKGTFSLLELEPKTGRTHQLRVHMAAIGHPIVGDALYTRREDPWHLGRQFLHAASIEFTLPSGERIRFDVDLPPELEEVLTELRNTPPEK